MRPRKLLEAASEENLDLLLVIEVKVSVLLRTGAERNETSLKLYTVSDGKNVKTAKSINNIAVYIAREGAKNGDDDPVDVMIDQILSDFADEQFKLQDLPKLDAEKAKNRVRALIASKYDNPLACVGGNQVLPHTRLVH